MDEKSRKNTKLDKEKYEHIRGELVEILSQPGGGPQVFTDLQKMLIEGLDSARKEAVKREGQVLVCKKLMEMDSLIISSAVHNLKCSKQNMCGVHFPLVKFARDILAEQKDSFDKLTNKGKKIKEPFDLSFLVSVKTEIKEPGESLVLNNGDKREKIWQLRAEGLTVREIAKEMGISKSIVGKIIKENNNK